MAVSRLTEDHEYGLSVQFVSNSQSADREICENQECRYAFEPQYQEYLAKRKSKKQYRNSWHEPALAAVKVACWVLRGTTLGNRCRLLDRIELE